MLPTFIRNSATSIWSPLIQSLGLAAFVLSVINFRRDRAILRVTLLKAEDLPETPGLPALRVEIANTGRRPVFLRQTGIRARTRVPFTWHDLKSEIINCRLGEGDAPISKTFMLKDLHGYRRLSALQAFADDSSGRKLTSKVLPSRHFPDPKTGFKSKNLDAT